MLSLRSLEKRTSLKTPIWRPGISLYVAVGVGVTTATQAKRGAEGGQNPARIELWESQPFTSGFMRRIRL